MIAELGLAKPFVVKVLLPVDMSEVFAHIIAEQVIDSLVDALYPIGTFLKMDDQSVVVQGFCKGVGNRHTINADNPSAKPGDSALVGENSRHSVGFSQQGR